MIPSRRVLTRSGVIGTLLLAGAVAGGCTFGGLANYAIDECVPSLPQADDVCDRLNKSDPQTCTPYQCSQATRHCVQKTRDDDHDGDPSTACGGTDCDDKDAARSGRGAETCDLVDNNCNGVIDEDAVKPRAEHVVFAAGALTSSADPSLNAINDRDLLAAYVVSSGQGTCIPLVELQPGSGRPHGTGCALLSDDLTLVPHQPNAILIGTGAGAAFVSTSACTSGHLAYRFVANGSTGFDVACDAAHPAALPAVKAMPESANAKSGVVAWYEIAVSERVDPIGGCATNKPASLDVALIDDLTSQTSLSPARILRTTETSTGTRPPTLVPVDAAHGIVMAAPLGNDVGLWLLTRDALMKTDLPAAQHVSSLAGAHVASTALAVHADGATLRVALAVEAGCHPTASISLLVGTLDPATGTFTFGAPIEVAPKSDVATEPSVAWVSSRGGEWWVSWIDDQPHARVLRFDPKGKPIGAAIDAGKPFLVGAVTGGESVFGFDPAANGGAFVEVPLGCGP